MLVSLSQAEETDATLFLESCGSSEPPFNDAHIFITSVVQISCLDVSESTKHHTGLAQAEMFPTDSLTDL